jgi:type II secretory pathway pseudopilin PulG
MKRTSGFTVIELLFVIALLGAASILFFTQKNNVETTARDDQRKVAINAIYYGLEEVYYKQHAAYPRTVDEKNLPSVDPELFTDPNGIKLGQTTVTIDDTDYPVASDYHYEGVDCKDDTCKGYTLRTTLQKEDDFVKTNRNK